ncbi:Protein of unknown function [Gryllus bimaculatus]|nr:Protein of unknown function [Gryllus bimaculatus]
MAVQHERGPRNSTLRRQMALYFGKEPGSPPGPSLSPLAPLPPLGLQPHLSPQPPGGHGHGYGHEHGYGHGHMAGAGPALDLALPKAGHGPGHGPARPEPLQLRPPAAALGFAPPPHGLFCDNKHFVLNLDNSYEIWPSLMEVFTPNNPIPASSSEQVEDLRLRVLELALSTSLA